MSPLEVLIVGGGIGGLAAALAAARAGCEVRLYERAPAFSEVGAGIQLGPNVTRILIDWGLEDELRAVASFPERLLVRDAETGDALGALRLGERTLARYGAPYATIHRADIHRLLARAAMAEERVHLSLNHQLIEYTQTAGAVALTLDREPKVEGDVLIGADGVWSRVRQQLLDDGPAGLTGHLAYRAMLRTDGLPEELRANQVTAWLGPHLHVVQYPVRGGQWTNVVAIIQAEPPADAQDWDHGANAADLARALGEVCAPLRALLAAAPGASVNEHPWRLWALADRPPVQDEGQMARGLVALLGDAAHPMRPFLAQGAAMAIEDAAELARALAMDAVDVPTRLKRYALARWQRCARVQARSARNGEIFHATGLMRWGRDASIRLLGERLLDVPWLYGR
jgi:salicylate hydroxylase